MGLALFDKYQTLTQKADELLGYSIKEICLANPGNALGQTRFAQPAIFIINTFHYLEYIEQQPAAVDFALGHSLGEYNALLAAGVFDFETGLRLVKKRAELMAAAAGGAMAAVLGLAPAAVHEVLRSHQLDSLYIANENSLSQTVISGDAAQITTAEPFFRAAGAEHYVRLNVGGAFHSPHMAAAAKEFERFLNEFEFSALTLPVIANTHAGPYKHLELKQTLAGQITAPVRWKDSILYVLRQGEVQFVEIGKAKPLTKFVKNIRASFAQDEQETSRYKTLTDVFIRAGENTELGITFLTPDPATFTVKEVFHSYHDIYKAARKLLHRLQAKGIGPHDQVVFQIESENNFVIAFWACVLGGFLPVPVEVRNHSDHLLKVFKIWDILEQKYILTSRNRLAGLEEFAAKNNFENALREIQEKAVVLDEIDYAPENLGRIHPAAPENPALIQFSSGTTGEPKGVMLTHGNLITNLADIGWGLAPCHAASNKTFSWMPLTHDMGLIGFHLFPTFIGINQILAPTVLFLLFPTKWLELAARHKATYLASPNSGLNHFLKLFTQEQDAANKPPDLDLACVKLIFNGAEPISYELAQDFLEKLAPFGLKPGVMYPVYGLAEATLAVSFPHPGQGLQSVRLDRNQVGLGDQVVHVDSQHPQGIHFVDLGRPLPHVSVRIVDGQDRPLPDGCIGRIQIKGANVTSGYFQNQAATQAAFTSAGWFVTGDLGFFQNGRLIVTGREKDIIFVGGLNYYSHDIENTLQQSLENENRQIAAVGVFNHQAKEDELLVFIADKTMNLNAMVPLAVKLHHCIQAKIGITIKQIIPVERIPKTTSGKLQRAKLRKDYLAGEFDQGMERLAKLIDQELFSTGAYQPDGSGPDPVIDPGQVLAELRRIAAGVLKIKPQELDIERNIGEYGFTSLALIKITTAVNRKYGVALKPAVFFEHQSLAAFGHYLVTNHLTKPAPVREQKLPHSRAAAEFKTGQQADAIAIIGISGRMPQSKDLEAFWNHLECGHDLISVVPKERWDWQARYGTPLKENNKTTAKWGGFMDHVAAFDARFFGITPHEAELMDPQQRLFLQTAWHTIENAGYRPGSLADMKIGVFVGVGTSDYAELVHNSGIPVDAYTATGLSHSILANRISYMLNLHGPSEPVDTACSSSLVALHRAVEAIRSGTCSMALAGGVNVMLTPTLNIAFNCAGMLAADGKCKTFDMAADGYVRGEGVGAVLLKPLAAAEKDRDFIYAVIKSTAVNHGGKAQSITAPNVNAQAALIVDAVEKAGIDPATITYIETHGTGTALGDPAEIQGLVKAFSRLYAQGNKAFAGEARCGLGSVKTNIGHLETAAGIAGLIKLVLALKHGKLPAGIHFKKLNPYIDIADTPFYVVEKTKTWDRLRDEKNQEIPHRAGISSFGFGGVNAHAVLEEYIIPADSAPGATRPATPSKQLIILSAGDEARLRCYVEDLLDFIEKAGPDDPSRFSLADMAWTLQSGREAMAARAAWLVASKTELAGLLRAYLNTDDFQDERFFKGRVQAHDPGLNEDTQRPDGNAPVDYGDLPAIARSWVSGRAIDWRRLHGSEAVKRMPLPTYPFAKTRYWVQAADAADNIAPAAAEMDSVFQAFGAGHAFDARANKYSLQVKGDEFYIADHKIGQAKVLPGAMYLEMARALAEQFKDGRVRKLQDVVWARPIQIAAAPREVHLHLSSEENAARFQFSTEADPDGATMFSKGRLVYDRRYQPAGLDIETIKGRCSRRKSGSECYALFSDAGLNYGPNFQPIQELFSNHNESLAQLKLPQHLKSSLKHYPLHPILIDGAFQTVIGLLSQGNGAHSEKLFLPMGIEELEILGELPETCFAYATVADSGRQLHAEVKKFHIRLLDIEGNPLVSIKNFCVKAIQEPPAWDDNPPQYYYHFLWKKAESTIATTEIKNLQTILLLDTDGDLRDALEQLLKDQNLAIKIILVTADERFQQKGASHFSLNPEESENYGEFIKVLGLDPESRIGIIHNWSKSRVGRAPAALGRRLAHGFYSVFFLTQALMASRLQNKVDLIYVYPLQTDMAPHWAAMSGLVKTIYQENPNYRYKTLTLKTTSGQGVNKAPWQTARLIVNEFQMSFSEPADIRYLNDHRYTKALKPVEADGPSSAIAFRPKGIYLITGGAGRLGMIFAEYLAKKTQGTVILVGRSKFSPDISARISQMDWGRATVEYIQADIARPLEVKRLVAEVKSKHHAINGILHCAGVSKDAFVLRKTKAEIQAVLAPKVSGTRYLDVFTKNENLDFFILFSSLAAVFGNSGQSDYAYANSYLDHFAVWRERLRRKGRRHGKTLAINWPLWQQGGMGHAAALQNHFQEVFGLLSLNSAAGIQAFEYALTYKGPQLAVIAGSAPMEQEQGLFNRKEEKPAVSGLEVFGKGAAPDLSSTPMEWKERLTDFLKKELCAATKLDPARVRADTPFEKFGIDSLMIMRLNVRLEKHFGEIPKTLFFEYSNLVDLADYFIKRHPEKVVATMGHQNPPAALKSPENTYLREVKTPESSPMNPKPVNQFRHATAQNPQAADEDIAVVGLSGRYPLADNVEIFWRNLVNGKDCITEIPKERWDLQEFYDPNAPQPGKSKSKWGGFIQDADKFDPLFFNISPREAEYMDPQERLFLQTAWHTLEDAGHTRASLSEETVGVFVGVMWGEYQMFGQGVRPSSSYWSIANRVSYVFNFSGPSMAVDTACSSSLSAVHLACESIQRGHCTMAVAGGVNLSLHPNKYLLLSLGNFIAGDGRCRSFGQGGDGYVPGEGVGAVLLKPLGRAIADGDNIQAVIKGTAVNHGGRTNGYTVPNPKAQSRVILNAFKRANVDPRTISCLEAHGTGTALGDPIEIAGLISAFEQGMPSQDSDGRRQRYCSIGSVKSNIGHLESAAGMAALTKVILQMKHKKLVPSLHAEIVNPLIDFKNSPFHLQAELSDWKKPLISQNGQNAAGPRRAGISSFGAGGSNSHLIVEEFETGDDVQQADPALGTWIFVLSARNSERLKAYAETILDFFKDHGLMKQTAQGVTASATHMIMPAGLTLTNFCYTFQVGREAMPARLALLVSGWDDLAGKLNAYCLGEHNIEQVWINSDGGVGTDLDLLLDGEEGLSFLNSIIHSKKFQKLAKLWVSGLDINWHLLYPGLRPRRISAPAYPFAKERCWITVESIDQAPSRMEPVPKTVPARQPEIRFEKTAWAESRTVPLLVEKVSSLLKINKASLRLDTALADYGLDSITSMRLANEIEKAFGIKLALESIQTSSMEELARRIDAQKASPPNKPDSATRSADSDDDHPAADKFGFLEQPEIPITLANQADLFPPAVHQAKELQTRRILLTGATGVLGGRLVKDFLENTDSTIYCLVRAQDREHAKKRIRAMLQIYSPNQRLSEQFEQRVIPVVGDVIQPDLKMSAKEYHQLAQSVDMVIHSAAKTSLHGNYRELKVVNVDGTRHMIDFCLNTAQRYFVFVSSYVVMGDRQFTASRPYTEKDFQVGQGFENLGYARSKYEAEKLVRLAHGHGLRWIIARPGNIMGDSRLGTYPLGKSQVPGIFYDIFKTVVKNQIAVNAIQFFDIAPSDYVGQSLVYLSTQLKTVFATYHLNNPHPKTFKEIMDLLAGCGFGLNYLEIDEFKASLDYIRKYDSLTADLLQFNPAMMPHNESTYADATYTAAILEQAGIRCPRINQALMETYMKYCLAVNYIQKNTPKEKLVNKMKYEYIKKMTTRGKLPGRPRPGSVSQKISAALDGKWIPRLASMGK